MLFTEAYLFGDSLLLYIPGWLRTHYTDEADTELTAVTMTLSRAGGGLLEKAVSQAGVETNIPSYRKQKS